jgi:hypothetical protein
LGQRAVLVLTERRDSNCRPLRPLSVKRVAPVADDLDVRRFVVGACVVALGAVAVARWTVWRPGASSGSLAPVAHVQIGSVPFRAPTTTSIYFAPSTDVWPLPAALRVGHSHGQVLTVPEAKALFEAFWGPRERAAAMLDVAMLKRLETGAALQADVALARAELAAHRDSRPLRTQTLENVIVPRQGGYPAWLMVRTHVPGAATPADPQTTNGFEDILIFTKAAANQTWKLAVDVTFDPSLLPAAILATHGPGVVPAPSDPGPAARGLRDLSDYYQYWYAHRTAPQGNEFAPGPGTTTEGAQIASPEPGVNIQRIATQPKTNQVFTLPLEHGWTLACGDLQNHAISRASPWRYLWQPPDRSNWGDRLTPGRYREITSTVERQVCIARQAKHAPMLVYGGQYALINVTGVRSRAPGQHLNSA